MRRRWFTQDFKKFVVEQLLSETDGPADPLVINGDVSLGDRYRVMITNWLES